MKKLNVGAHKTKIARTLAISILFVNITDLNATKYAIIANSSSKIPGRHQEIGRAFLKQDSIKNVNGDPITPVGNADINASIRYK